MNKKERIVKREVDCNVNQAQKIQLIEKIKIVKSRND